MKTVFPKKELHVPQWFLIDAKEKRLGRLASETSKLLRGKETSFYTPGVDQGNFVVILNASKIEVSGKKEDQKLYYRNSNRPGGLKKETFKELKQRIPARIVEKAIWGMLPKGTLGRIYNKRLYVYKDEKILYKNEEYSENRTQTSKNWKKIDIN